MGGANPVWSLKFWFLIQDTTVGHMHAWGSAGSGVLTPGSQPVHGHTPVSRPPLFAAATADLRGTILGHLGRNRPQDRSSNGIDLTSLLHLSLQDNS